MKKAPKETDYSFIQDLKPVCVLKKKGSPHTIEFFIDPEDDWFYHVITRKTAKKTVVSGSLIIRKDVEQWIGYHEGMGWVATRSQELNLSCE